MSELVHSHPGGEQADDWVSSIESLHHTAARKRPSHVTIVPQQIEGELLPEPVEISSVSLDEDELAVKFIRIPAPKGTRYETELSSSEDGQVDVNIGQRISLRLNAARFVINSGGPQLVVGDQDSQAVLESRFVSEQVEALFARCKAKEERSLPVEDLADSDNDINPTDVAYQRIFEASTLQEATGETYVNSEAGVASQQVILSGTYLGNAVEMMVAIDAPRGDAGAADPDLFLAIYADQPLSFRLADGQSLITDELQLVITADVMLVLDDFEEWSVLEPSSQNEIARMLGSLELRPFEGDDDE